MNNPIRLRSGICPEESNYYLGPIRSQLYAYAFAKKYQIQGVDSKIVFRVDDTNPNKHTKDGGVRIWNFFKSTLGAHYDINPDNSMIEIDQSVFQSERYLIYSKYLDVLKKQKLAYEDSLSEAFFFDIEEFIKEFGSTIIVKDLEVGERKFDLLNNVKRGEIKFPIVRSNGTFLYHFTTVIDDYEFGISHILRAADKIPIIVFQEMLRIALKFPEKTYLHLPLLLNSSGEYNSNIATFNEYVKKGYTTEALISYCLASGYDNTEGIFDSLQDFVEKFEYSKINLKVSKFNEQKLNKVNDFFLKNMSDENYFTGYRKYLRLNQTELDLDMIGLAGFLSIARRNYLENDKMIELILNPIHENLKSDLKHLVLRLINEFGSGINFNIAKNKFKSDKKNFYDACRWLFVGTYSFPHIELVYEVLIKNNMLLDRLILIKNNISTQYGTGSF